MNVLIFEFKNKIKTLILWEIGFAFIAFLFMTFYPTFSKDTEVFDLIIKNYPEMLLKAFGLNREVSLSSVLGFFSFVFSFTQLTLAIQASYYGFSLLTIEQREFTADFLLSKPKSRTDIYLGKLFGTLLLLIVTHLFLWPIQILSIEIFRDGHTYDMMVLLRILLGSFFLSLSFFFISLGLSMLFKKINNVLSMALAISFGTYVLQMLKGIIGGDYLGLFTPFYYYETNQIIASGKLSTDSFLFLGVTCFVGLAYSLFVYRARDIHAL